MPNNPYNNECCCFAGRCNNYVTKERGKTWIEELKVGDEVLAMSEEGSFVYSEIFALGHKNDDAEVTFLEIRTFNRQIHISPRHYIGVMKGEKLEMVQAKDVKPGDLFLVREGEEMDREEVLSIEEIEGKGVYAPFTKEGTIVVNGILASCYAEVQPRIAHTLLAPVRLAYDYTPTAVMETFMTPNSDGIPHVFNVALNGLKPTME